MDHRVVVLTSRKRFVSVFGEFLLLFWGAIGVFGLDCTGQCFVDFFEGGIEKAEYFDIDDIRINLVVQ